MNYHKLSMLMTGARNYIKFIEVKPGEQVLMVASLETEPEVIQAISIAIEEKGGILTTTYAPPPKVYFTEVTPPLAEAFCAADVVLDVGAFIFGHSESSIRAMYEYGTRGSVLSPPPTSDILMSAAARYPLEVHRVVARKVYEACQQPDGTKIKLTAPNGTDVDAEVWQGHTGKGVEYAGANPGDFSIFPPGCLGFTPPRNVNGRAVFEAYTGIGRVETPLEFIIEEQYIKEIRGGWEADELRSRIKGIKNADYVCEIMFGMNPANRVNLNTKPLSFESERTPRTLHIGIGDISMCGGPIHAQGKPPDWKVIHQDGFMVYPTLVVGGRTILDHGHLTILDDPEVRDIAGKFGDPDKVLAYGSVTF